MEKTIAIAFLFTTACATVPNHAEDVREYGVQRFARTPADVSLGASRSLADLGYTVDSVDADHITAHRAAAAETFIDAVDNGPRYARTVDIEIVRDGGASYLIVLPRVFTGGREVTDDASARAGELREMQSIIAYTVVELPPDFDALCFFLPFNWWQWFVHAQDETKFAAADRALFPMPMPIAAHAIASSTPVTHDPPLARVERPIPRRPRSGP